MSEEVLDHMLSADAFYKGYRLIWYKVSSVWADPIILSHHGFEVYRWEYDPSMGEVWDKIKELEDSL